MHDFGSTARLRQINFKDLVQQCLTFEQGRNLTVRTIKDLKRYLTEFIIYCYTNGITTLTELKPSFLKEYVEHRCHKTGPSVKKAVVWSLRKFGQYLHVTQLLDRNPASCLRHPTFPPRAKLPEYLSEWLLRKLLVSAACTGSFQQFAIISLVAATGLRPSEVCALRPSDIHLEHLYLDVRVKGGWCKRTPLSSSMALILGNHLATLPGDSKACFLNKQGLPLSVGWLQRMVKTAGQRAGLPRHLTCNQLRHTFATYAADCHGKVITKALMGHQNLATTEIYTHLSPRYFNSVMQHHPYNAEQRRR